MNKKMEEFKNLPGVDKLLEEKDLKALIEKFGKEITVFYIRQALDSIRKNIQKGIKVPEKDQIIESITKKVSRITKRSLKPVINASGIIIHTNLGRAPFGECLLKDSLPILKDYTNLEFDLDAGKRGNRNDHLTDLLKFLTDAEDIAIVNNNAAAVMLILRAFAKNKEVVISRGELIEIGGSFRIPEIMAASDCKMVEVGATNKTSIKDYESAITEDTSIIFKAHKSNYSIKGFTEEVNVNDLSKLSAKHKLIHVYDIGSGLLRKVEHKKMKNEPDVKEAINMGADIVCFSGDKLLGGPQAGIIAGKKELIEKLKKEPMFRALRVCKTTLALLETACLYYLNDNDLFSKNAIFRSFDQPIGHIELKAEKLKKLLEKKEIPVEITKSKAFFGGGTLPDLELNSFSVQIIHKSSNKDRSLFAEKLHHNLLQSDSPILSILKKGNVYFDLFTIDESELPDISDKVHEIYDMTKAQLK